MKTHLITLIKETPSLLVGVIKWSGRMNPLISLLKLITTIISITTGDSAEKKKLVVCRISAGFSSVFNTLLFFTETMPEEIKGHVL